MVAFTPGLQREVVIYSKCARGSTVLLSVATGIVSSVVFASPAQADPFGCTVSTPNVHISTHSGGTRLNFVPSVSCVSRPSRSLLLEAQVQKLINGSWVNADFSGATLNNTPTYVRLSLSGARLANTTTYRGRARKIVDGLTSAWQYSSATSIPGVGNGGGGGGGWAVPTTQD